MNLFTTGDVTLADMAYADEFDWQLIAEVHEGRVPAIRFEAVKMKISRRRLPGGRGWSDWRVDKVNRCKIEAVLGLWMLHFKN